METIPWYKSAIIRQQIVQIIVALTAFFGITTDVDWSATVEAIFAGIAAIVAVWTIITRLVKPTPPVTVQAAQKTVELQRKQGGFARLETLVMVGVLAAIVGCAGTKQAYRAADSLPDQAFVVAEHYAALVKEAADIAQNPATPEAVKEQLKAADRVLKPLVVGDPTQTPSRPGLKELADAYQATRTAQTEAELQAAVNNAVVALAGFIKAVKAARGEYVGSTDAGSGRTSKRCARAGIERPDEDLGRLVCVG